MHTPVLIVCIQAMAFAAMSGSRRTRRSRHEHAAQRADFELRQCSTPGCPVIHSQVGIGIAATYVATHLGACTAGAVTAYSAPWCERALSLGYTQQTVGFRAAIGASVMVSVSVAAHAALVGTADDAMGCGWFSSGILIRALLPHIQEPVQLM